MEIEPVAQKMQMRCGNCRTIYNGAMLVGVPVEQAIASMLANRCPSCGNGKKQLLGQTRSAAEDDFMRTVGPEEPVERRTADWISNGETGRSAVAIMNHMSAARVPSSPDKTDVHPRDAGDLHRCMLLLRRIPEWERRMREMSVHSPEWKALAENWKELSATFAREAGPNLDVWPRPETGALLERLVS